MTATATRIHPEIDPPWVGAVELCAKAGITYRQCDYWTRTGHLKTIGEPTPGNGFSRAYTEIEVEVARHAKLLIDAGFLLTAALHMARDIVEHPDQPIQLADGLVVINTEVTD